MMKFPRVTPEKAIGTLFILCGFGFILWGCTNNDQAYEVASPDKSATSLTTRTPCRVLNVFDGDTFACDLNENGLIEKGKEHVRLLGIDAPEMHYSKKNKSGKDEFMAVEAKEYLIKNALKKTIYLEWDKQRHDRYGRPLAFVFESEHATVSMNQTLLEKGYATTLFIKPNGLHKAEFYDAEAYARQNKLGIWQK